jgi:hypothetical protein
MTPDLMGLLASYLSNNAGAAPTGQPMPSNPGLLGSQGVLGQGLTGQAQQIDQASSGAPAAPPAPVQPPPSGGDQLPPPMPPQGIRPWAFTHLDPKDWTPEETAAFNQAHGIEPHQSQLAQLLHMLLNAGGSGSGPASAK